MLRNVFFLFLWIYLLRSCSRVSLGLLVCLVVSLESRILKTFFRPPSMLLDLSILFHTFCQAQVYGTLPGTLFCCLSAVLCPFYSSFVSPSIATWSMSLTCRVSLRSGCQSLLELSIGGNYQDVLSKSSFVNRGSVSLVRSKCLGLINWWINVVVRSSSQGKEVRQ